VWQRRPYISSSASVQTKLSGYGASPGIAPLWHRSRPYKARYGVRMPAMELSLGSDVGEELRYCRVSFVSGLSRPSRASPALPSDALAGSSAMDQDSRVTLLAQRRRAPVLLFYAVEPTGNHLDLNGLFLLPVRCDWTADGEEILTNRTLDSNHRIRL